MKFQLQMKLVLVVFVFASTVFHGACTQAAPAWSTNLEKNISNIDTSTRGNLGVYVKRVGSGEEMNYQADRPWYFASTIKVLVAIAVLQMVEEGKVSLDQELILRASDPVDGSGEVQFKKTGSKLKVKYLIEKMITQSDSTATDMLIRMIGEDELNSRIRSKMGVSDFQPFTTILSVREKAYSFLHPNAKNLTNRDFIDLKKIRSTAARYRAVAKKMKVSTNQLREKSIEAAFEKYYLSGLNTGSLKSFGVLLEKLTLGQLLSKPHTDLLMSYMSTMETGDRRIKAGLPKGTQFAQKTGTQVARICNVGIIIGPASSGKKRIVVASCLEKFGGMEGGEATMQKVGKALLPLLKEEFSKK